MTDVGQRLEARDHLGGGGVEVNGRSGPATVGQSKGARDLREVEEEEEEKKKKKKKREEEKKKKKKKKKKKRKKEEWIERE